MTKALISPTEQVAKDLIQIFETSEFKNLEPVLAKYGVYRIDPLAIQKLVNLLSFKLCRMIINGENGESDIKLSDLHNHLT